MLAGLTVMCTLNCSIEADAGKIYVYTEASTGDTGIMETEDADGLYGICSCDAGQTDISRNDMSQNDTSQNDSVLGASRTAGDGGSEDVMAAGDNSLSTVWILLIMAIAALFGIGIGKAVRGEQEQ